MCIFCSIVKGEIPSQIVYQDETTMAILDISQATKGHTLVIPKKHFDNFLDVDDQTLAHMITVSQKVGKKLVKNLNADGINVVNNCNEAAGQAVMHLHIHLIPRYYGDDYLMKGTAHDYNLDEVLKEINKN